MKRFLTALVLCLVLGGCKETCSQCEGQEPDKEFAPPKEFPIERRVGDLEHRADRAEDRIVDLEEELQQLKEQLSPTQEIANPPKGDYSTLRKQAISEGRYLFCGS